MTGDDGTNTIHINANDGSITASQSIAVGENTYITTDGINANDQKITNVKAGEADTDAVNVSQLKGVQQQVSNNSLAITNLGNKVNQLDNRVDKVGAGAAALAAFIPSILIPTTSGISPPVTAITVGKTRSPSAPSTVLMKTPCSASAEPSATATTWSTPASPSNSVKVTAYRRPVWPWPRKLRTFATN